MNRRNAFIALMSIPLGAFTFKDARADPAHPAALRICLDDWSGFTVQHQGKSVFVSSAEIFKSLSTKERT